MQDLVLLVEVWFQGPAATLLSSVAAALPLGYAFGAGMVTTANPCGFALLSAYLGLHLGERSGRSEESRPMARLGRALAFGIVVTAAFLLIFGIVGAGLALGGRFLIGLMPWLGLAVGMALLVAGVAMWRGRAIAAPGLERLVALSGDPRTPGVRGFFAFGVAYAIASLSCTLPVFLAVVGSGMAVGGFLSGLSQLASYALGMGAVMVALTLAIALFREGALALARRAAAGLPRVSAALLVVAGGYIIGYWLFAGGLLAPLPS